MDEDDKGFDLGGALDGLKQAMEERAKRYQQEQQMKRAEVFQQAWQTTLDMLDGAVAESMRHGWSEDQARMLIYATYVSGLLSPLAGPATPSAE